MSPRVEYIRALAALLEAAKGTSAETAVVLLVSEAVAMERAGNK